jgi:polysaccharide deacetylase 2 family uncharacterized protein YibQ
VRALLLVIAIPFLAALIWLGYRFVQGAISSAPEGDSASMPAAKEPAAPPITATVVETPRIERALLDAGIDRDRMRWDNGHLLVETFDGVDEISLVIEARIPGCVVERQDDMLVISHGGLVERLRVVQLQRDTGIDGLTPALPERQVSTRARRAEATGERKIVLILDDVGYENQPLEDAVRIDARISFAVIPGTPKATQSAEFLASRGYEILCHLPMEPLDPNVSPGDLAIFTDMSDEAIRSLATSNIESIPHVRGVNNHMGSRATRDRRVMENVANALLQTGVYFIDSRTAGNSVAAQVTRKAKIPTGTRDVFLDDDPAEAAVRRQLRELVRLSESREFVIGIGHVYPSTVRVLRAEIPRLSAAGYEFLFASDVLR